MRPRLRPPSPDYEYSAWAHNALGGLPAAIDPGIFLGAKTIAATLLDLLTEPALLQQAQDEFRERTGGGVGGTKWVAPLLPKDFTPPVDLRWPEYIHTARGEEWWIPPLLSDQAPESCFKEAWSPCCVLLVSRPVLRCRRKHGLAACRLSRAVERVGSRTPDCVVRCRPMRLQCG